MTRSRGCGLRARQGGLSMIEVLVTILVVSFGLLALAGLMMNGLKANNTANLRSVAVQQAYNLVDRMRANMKGVRSGNYDAMTYTAGQTCTPCVSGCGADVRADTDVCEWNVDNERLLPLGRGVGTRVAASGDVFKVTISWDDNRSGSADTSLVVYMEP